MLASRKRQAFSFLAAAAPPHLPHLNNDVNQYHYHNFFKLVLIDLTSSCTSVRALDLTLPMTTKAHLGDNVGFVQNVCLNNQPGWHSQFQFP